VAKGKEQSARAKKNEERNAKLHQERVDNDGLGRRERRRIASGKRRQEEAQPKTGRAREPEHHRDVAKSFEQARKSISKV
jgi:hypothetical protein